MRINKRAFTIIELIVVIAILGILILLAGPRLLGYVEKAELARIQHDVKVMENKMSDVLTTDNIFNDWQNNAKDLGRVVMRKELYEKQGVAKSIEWEHLSAKWLHVNNDKEDNDLGMGGDLIEIDDKYSTYKIIPKEYSSKINTKLKGTFYVNSLGKVYYEHDKPLAKASEKEVLACVAPETLNYEFEIINGLGTITGWNGNATHLVIPAAFKMSEGGKEWCEPVRVIGARAFQNGNFKKVTIPQSVEEIQDEAFQGGELIEIEIPHSVKTVGNNAFTGNPATSGSGGSGSEGSGGGSIIMKGSSNGRSISGSAFGGSTPSYSSVTAKDLGVITKTNGGKTVSIIGKTVTSDSSSSNSNTVINIPKELEINGEILPVTEIEKGAFQGSGLIDVIMPEGLLYIHDYAFAGNQLIRAVIPNSVIEVGNYAFAYNEIASKPTIDPINILESKFIGDFNNVNNEGNISKPISNIDLKDHIFIISSMGNHVIEDVGTNPEQSDNSAIKIIVNNPYIDTETNLNIDYKYNGVVLDEQWMLNGELLDNKPSVIKTAGRHELQLRIQDETGAWSNWSKVNFIVHEYEEFMMNIPGSNALIAHNNYSIGNHLIFNYTNDDNLNWTVPLSGTYKIDALGAGAGGKGARVQGEVELVKGQVLNFKIHEKSNGGGVGGSGGASHYKGTRGGNGSGGTLLKLNESLILAAGGSGGNGGVGGTRSSGSGPSGGYGGDGGNLSGLAGKTGSRGYGYDGYLSGGSGGTTTSSGGGPGYNLRVGHTNGRGNSGNNGPTLYDGGGGGGGGSIGAGLGSYYASGGGGGAGGKSFINESLIQNPIVTPGHNSGHGKVILTLISK